MFRHLDNWDELYITTLPINEDDRFDRKASAALVNAATGQNAAKVRQELSADISAFANSGGGYIIFGISNDGTIDGGVSKSLKGSTHEWLDSIVSGLVEYRLPKYRIKVIEPQRPDSQITPGNAVYVVQIPDSEAAPHQAKDGRYYARMNGHNEIAPHWLVEDIRGRRRNPLLEGYVEFNVGQTEWFRDKGIITTRLWPVCHLSNVGRVTAKEVSLVFNYPESARTVYNAIRNLVRCETDSDRRQLTFHLLAPIHPTQSVPVIVGETQLTLEYGTFAELQTRKRIHEIEFSSMAYPENASPVPIEASFACERVSKHLREALVSQFGWTDPHAGTYRP